VSDGHLVTAMITGCVALGAAPDVEDYVDVVPVDYVSRALVNLSLRESAQGHNFHLVNPAFVRWCEIADQLRAAGYPLAAVSLPQWREAVRARGEADNPMRPFLPMLDERALFSGRRYDSRRAAGLLAGSGISCPPLDARLIGTYLSGLVDSGALPPPPGTGP
jgi:thioester reductase-like protein